MSQLRLEYNSKKLQNGLDVLVIEFIGTLQKTTFNQIESQLYQSVLHNQLHNFIFDCKKLTHITSFSFGIFLNLQRKLKNVVFIHFSKEIMKIFNETELDQILNIYTSEEQAEKFLRSQYWADSHNTCALYVNTSEEKTVSLSQVNMHIEILDITSHMQLSQTYINTEKQAIEAIYRFPIHPSFVVHSFEIQTQQQVFTAKIEERIDAFSLYDKNIEQGNSSYLLEQEEEIATIFVGNILPNQEITVKIQAVAQLPIIDDQIQLRIPINLHPRYSSQPNINETYSSRTNCSFHLEVHIDTNTIESASCKSHQVELAHTAKKLTVKLQQNHLLSNDFVLYLQPKKNQSICITAKHTNGIRALMLRMFPQVDQEHVKESRELIFIIDCSTSMKETAINKAKEILILCLKSLNEGDFFNIIPFGAIFSLYKPKSSIYDETSMRQAIKYTQSLQANLGSKEMLKVLKYVTTTTGPFVKNVIILSDGHTDEIGEAIKATAKSQLRIFTFGIGSVANHSFVSSLPQASNGAGEVIYFNEAIDAKVLRQLARIYSVQFENQQLKVDGLQLDYNTIPSIFEGDSFTMYARIVRGTVGKKATLSAMIGTKVFQWKTNVVNIKTNTTIPTLWAANHSRQLNNNEEQYEEISNIGKKFNILTATTSFVAVQKQKHKKASAILEEPQTRKIPIQLTKDFCATTAVPMSAIENLPFAGKNSDISIPQSQGLSSSPLQPKTISFPHNATCPKCYRNLIFSSQGYYRCTTCRNYMIMTNNGQKTVYAKVDAQVLDVTFPSHSLYKKAIATLVVTLAQQVNCSKEKINQISESLELAISIVVEKRHHHNETFHMIAMADNEKIVVGLSCLHSFLTKDTRDARLGQIAKKVSKLEVYPLDHGGQMLKITIRDCHQLKNSSL